MWFPVTLAMPNAILETAVLSWPCHPLSAPSLISEPCQTPMDARLGPRRPCSLLLHPFRFGARSVAVVVAVVVISYGGHFQRCGCSLIVMEAHVGLEGGGGR